ncbi:hypothetical protein [Azotobacter chroococcum]|uniref:hypothetical protein n=1 Tax=Azotobacter chroococcum TaxID=353 RepID=UPI000B5DBAA4|nr:hypothetical protein [Azotobacter chroococcum]ASL27003.1 hypothetical protein ACG10_12425 [Azotobacter chroococcum]
MDMTTAALIGITLGTGIATAGCYLTGHAAGIRLGLQRAHRDGHDAAREQLAAELLESGQRLTSAERILAATRAELRQVQNERARERRQTAEALEEATLRLDEAQGLNAEHAALLRQASTNLELAAATWDAMTATRKARDARTVAHQLRELAAALGPERREVAA